MHPETLPGILPLLARLAGEEKAWECAEKLGGREIYIGSHPRPANPLLAIVGAEAMRRLAIELGSDTVTMPSARPQRRWQRAREMRAAGCSLPEIARELDISERHALRLTRGVHKGRPA